MDRLYIIGIRRLSMAFKLPVFSEGSEEALAGSGDVAAVSEFGVSKNQMRAANTVLVQDKPAPMATPTSFWT